jgi:hypothetical protein
MSVFEETIEATLDPNGQLILTHKPRVTPGPVQVTIRVAAAGNTHRRLADVVREIAEDQRARGFQGRSVAELSGDADAGLAEDAERDQELDSARGSEAS